MLGTGDCSYMYLCQWSYVCIHVCIHLLSVVLRFFIHLLCAGRHVIVYMGRSEGSLQESVLCFYHVGPGCRTRVIRLQMPLSTCRLPEGFICMCVRARQPRWPWVSSSVTLHCFLFILHVYICVSEYTPHVCGAHGILCSRSHRWCEVWVLRVNLWSPTGTASPVTALVFEAGLSLRLEFADWLD